MYILTPLLLIFSSLLGITVIVWRKWEYIKKLAMIESGSSEEVYGSLDFSLGRYGRELFPEVEEFIKKIKFDEYKTSWLLEVEKLLRKIRLIFLKIDSFSDSLIKKVRRVHANGKLNGQATNEVVEHINGTQTQKDLLSSQSISPAFLRNEEERLIIEIAHNPKDHQLYEKLGDLYVEMNGFVDAKESYEAAIELSPQNEALKQKLSSTLEKILPQN